MMTLHKLSAGDGYTYYTHQVASGDALREQGRELGDYYTLEGMPPGQWIGSGVSLLEGYGEVRSGDIVTESQMADLFGSGAQPMTGIELAQTFSDAEHAGRKAAADSIETARIGHAEEAFKLYKAMSEQPTQSKIAAALSTDKRQIARRTVSDRIASYRDAGNPDPPKDEAGHLLSHDEFVASYVMTDAQERRAEEGAVTVKRAAIREHLKPYKLGSKFYTYRGRTEFQQRFHEEVQRHNRTEQAAPTREDFEEIRQRVGGELFRQSHGRDANSSEELSRWITAQDQNLKQSVAGYDMVFTPTKSVSIAWGLGDESLRKGIEEAHEAAIRDALGYLESNAVYTRRGYNGVRQVDVTGGLIATKFRHHDSRAGDPNLHDHVVVANKVMAEDGSWLTLDGRMLYRQNVAASEVYNSKIIEHIHSALGLEFTAHDQRGRKVFELAGIDPKLISGFSSRSREINETLEELEAKFVAEHGHTPTAKQRNALAQQATLATRPGKEDVTSLAERNVEWTAQAEAMVPDTPVGEDLNAHLKDAAGRQANATINASAQVAATPVAEHAQNVVERLEQQRSTWTEANIAPEVSRYFREAAAGSTISVERVEKTIEAVKDLSIGMTPAADVPVPSGLRRKDGSSVYRVAGSETYTSAGLIAAEDRLVRAATTTPVIPTASAESFASTLDDYRKDASWQPSPAQIEMARSFATSERLLAVGIGPAGAGKTTSTTLFVQAAQKAGHEVIGLAPTAAAASVMSQEMGISADTVDSFLAREQTVPAGSVLMVDEIGMVSTPNLSALVDRAETDGAVLRGIGDPRQLSAIGSGGALRLLEHEAGAVHLEDVHRFRTDGEAAASLALREPAQQGQKDTPFAWYQDQGRISAGPEERSIAELFNAWSVDTDQGRESLMMAPSGAQVAQLNELAQAKAMSDGLLDPTETYRTRAGATVHAGDTVVTRKNDRSLRLNRGKDFVKNGDTWQVRNIGSDGAVTLTHTSHAGTITVPADYATSSIELGYARTIARAQGATVDRAHVLVDASTSRANAYVGTSRGRDSNHIYVVTTNDSSRDDVLDQITSDYTRNLPIHEQVTTLRETHRAVAPRVEQYQDLALYAQEQAVATAARQALGDQDANRLIGSAGFGAFAHEVAEAMTTDGIQPQELISRAWQQRDFNDAQDIGAVMHHRIGYVLSDDARNQAKHPENTRPFSQVSDDHLDSLFAKAQQATSDHAEALEKAQANLEDPNWHKREFGLVPTRQLQARRVGLAQKMRDNDDPEWRELMSEMDAEVSRRRWSSPGQRLVEEVTRGERSRQGTDFPIAQALAIERDIRAQLLTRKQSQAPRPETITHGVSGHTVDTTWATHELTSRSLRQVMEAHHTQIGQLTTLRGKQIATEKPVWSEALGDVPANQKNAAQWYRVAGEVEAFRASHNIDDSEHRAIPKKYTRTEHGHYLATQVTEVHKRGALANRHGRSNQQNRLVAERAVSTRSNTESHTPAEQSITAASRRKEITLDTKWDDVVAAWQVEQQAHEKHQDAEGRLERARDELAQAETRRESLGTELIDKARADYQPVQDRAQALDEASVFTRSKRSSEYESALADYQQQYGADRPPRQGDQEWLDQQPDYQQAAAETEQAQNRVTEAEAEASVTRDQAQAATTDREAVYDSYESAREQDPATTVVTKNMNPQTAQNAVSSQRKRDLISLSKGNKPAQLKAKTGTATKAQKKPQTQRTIQQRAVQQQRLIQQQNRGRHL